MIKKGKGEKDIRKGGTRMKRHGINLCIFIYIYIYIHIHIYTYIFIFIYIYIHIYLYTYICINRDKNIDKFAKYTYMLRLNDQSVCSQFTHHKTATHMQHIHVLRRKATNIIPHIIYLQIQN